MPVMSNAELTKQIAFIKIAIEGLVKRIEELEQDVIVEEPVEDSNV